VNQVKHGLFLHVARTLMTSL